MYSYYQILRLNRNMKLLTRIDNYKKFADYLTAVGEIGFEGAV